MSRIILQEGHEYRFAQKGKTVAFRPLKDNPWVEYFMLLGTCDTVHECQKLPKQIVFAHEWWKMVAPDAWHEYNEYLRKQEELDTPR